MPQQHDPRSGHALFFDLALLPEGWARDVRLSMADGRIAAIETRTRPQPGDACHRCAIPGMPNLHSHAFQRAMAGLTERRGPGDDSFWTWREVMYRFVDALTPDDVQAIAALAYTEMLESGFTRVGEFHYLHHHRDGRPYAERAATSAAIAAAAAQTGIGLTLLPVFYAHADFGGAPPQPGQRRFINDLDGFALLLDGARRATADLPDAVVGIAPHSLRAVTPDELAALERLGHAGPIHIHIAEQMREVEACLAWSGQRPVEWLLDHADVDARWCLVHATHMTDTETHALAATGAVAGLCPITEANLGDGLFPAAPFLMAGGAIGVGSDSNVRIDMSEELRLLEYGQRLAARGRNLLAAGPDGSTGADLHAAALAGGARALGVAAGLAVGNSADLIGLDLDHPSLIGAQPTTLLDGLVFSAGSAAIDSVWRRGEPVVNSGRHRDRDAIAARYRATLARLSA